MLKIMMNKLNPTQSLLLDIYSSSASWYETSLKETNTKILYNSNVLSVYMSITLYIN